MTILFGADQGNRARRRAAFCELPVRRNFHCNVGGAMTQTRDYDPGAPAPTTAIYVAQDMLGTLAKFARLVTLSEPARVMP
jgi:hypothetical protein